jgi:hypothetical protein
MRRKLDVMPSDPFSNAFWFRELFEFRVMQTDPNFANYLYLPASGARGAT